MVNIHETTSPIISIKLDGFNYFVWSQILEIHIIGRKKKGYIIERKIALVEDDPNYDEWEAKNDQVKSWLINSMTNKLISHFVQFGMAKGVWDIVKRSYLDVFEFFSSI